MKMTSGGTPGNVAKAQVAIVGAGIVGVATGINLQRKGVEVLIVDERDPGEGASYGNAGVVASCAIVPVPVPGILTKLPQLLMDPMGPLAIDPIFVVRNARWFLDYVRHSSASQVNRIAGELIKLTENAADEHITLARGTRAEGMVRESDYYYVYHDPDNYAQESFAWNIRRDHGFIPEEVREAELRQIEPDLSSDFRFAVRLKRHGYSVDPGRLVKELVQTFLENGGRLLRSRVAGIATVPGKGVALETAHGLVPFDKLVIAAGAWSQDLLTSLGIKVPMISERGYHLEFRDTGIRHNNPLMVSSGKYVATPMSGRLRLAGIVDFRAMSRPPQQRFWDSLARHARQLFPTANLAYIEQWMGHRPSLPDSLPVIGPVPEFPNIILAFGHQHIGLTAGPKTGRLVAQLTNDERPNEDLTGFSVIRFGR